jgi:hypothetical protein
VKYKANRAQELLLKEVQEQVFNQVAGSRQDDEITLKYDIE